MARGKKGDEGSPTGMIVILAILGVFLVLIVFWQIGLFGKLETIFDFTKGYTLEAVQQKCELAVNHELLQDYCYFYNVEISGLSNEAYINCEYEPIKSKLETVDASFNCEGTAKTFCDNRKLSSSKVDLTKIVVSNDAGVIVPCSTLAGKEPCPKSKCCTSDSKYTEKVCTGEREECKSVDADGSGTCQLGD